MSTIVIDRTYLGKTPPPYKVKGTGQIKSRHRSKLRPLKQVDALCLHHWGVNVSIEPKKGETEAQAMIRRAMSTSYHGTVFRPGSVLSWRPELYTYHGNGLNAGSMGISIAGRFPERHSDYDPLIHDDAYEFAESLDQLIKELVQRMPGLKWLFTHSQATTKPSDPGEIITRLATRSAVGAGLRIDPNFKMGSGSPWISEWRKPLPISDTY